MGASPHQELESRLTTFVDASYEAGLATGKTHHQWEVNYWVAQRTYEIDKVSPSLKPLISEVLEELWSDARDDAKVETSPSHQIFSISCPWDMKSQILDKQRWPE
jgi:uncharacterized coiled-coil protein SlyX